MIHFKPFRFGRAEIITISILIILVVLVMGINYFPPIASWYTDITDRWTEVAVQYGYPGAFFAALLGNLTIVIIFPYTIAVFFLASSGLNPLYLGLLTGTGAILGELSGYVIGRWGSHRFQQAKPEAYDALKEFIKLRPKFIQWLLFIFSALPLPDDVLFIPLGMLRYSFWKLFWPSWIGKVVAALMITYTGNVAYHFTDHAGATSPVALFNQLGSLFTLTVTMYLLFKLDWQKIMHHLLNGRAPAATEENVK